MTSSTDVVNFRLRHNKGIERAIVFECLREASTLLGYSEGVYIGFGSVWFADFHLAHRELSVSTMISFEHDDIVFERARFNKPYRTVEVIHDYSTDGWDALFDRDDLYGRPWIVWLDYDKAMAPERLAELTTLVTRLPPDSALITTFSGREGGYGNLANRGRYLRDLFGADLVPDGLAADNYKDEKLCDLLAELTLNRLASTAQTFGRKGSFARGFKLSYRDGTPMVTVGGFLPSEDNAKVIRDLVADQFWRGFIEQQIATPPLTFKEVSALLGALPSDGPFRRSEVQQLGFDLEDRQLAAFITHYLRYPSYAEIAT